MLCPGAPTRGAPTCNPEIIELIDFFYQFTLFLIADSALHAVLKGHLPFWGALAPHTLS